MVQVGSQVGDSHSRRTGGSQFDGQRQPVQAPTDLGDDSQVVVVKLQIAVRRRRSLHEQPNRLAASKFLRGRPCRRYPEGGHRHDLLALDGQALAARGENDQSRAGAPQDLDQLGHRVEQMLAVVQDQQEALGAQKLDQRFRCRQASPVGQAEHRRHGPSQHFGVADCLQLHQPGPFPKAWQLLGRGA
jgi:hypothetical protein